MLSQIYSKIKKKNVWVMIAFLKINKGNDNNNKKKAEKKTMTSETN